jgi:hypothetical protein
MAPVAAGPILRLVVLPFQRGRWKTMTLTPHEFIRRFLMHVLPSGFHRIRQILLILFGNFALSPNDPRNNPEAGVSLRATDPGSSRRPPTATIISQRPALR